MSSPIVIEGGNLVVAINFNGDLIGVNAKDGIVMWRAEKATWQGKDAGYVAASPAIGKDGSLYIADYSGFLHGFVGNGGCPAGYHLSSNIDDLNCDFGLNCGTVDSSNTTSPPPPPSNQPAAPPPPMAPASVYIEACTPCADGLVAPLPWLGSSCQTCPAGTQFVAKEKECENCAPGWYRGNDFAPDRRC